MASNEVEITGVTVGALWEIAKKTWHVAILLVSLLWEIAAYKTALDTHLNNIDKHLQFQDRELHWLVKHSADGNDAPDGFYVVDPQYRFKNGKPQLWVNIPDFADWNIDGKSHDSAFSPTYVR